MVAEGGLATSRRDEDEVAVLQNAGIIESERLAEQLVKLIGFRKILVNRYWLVEKETVTQLLRSNLPDIAEYCETVSRFLDAETEQVV